MWSYYSTRTASFLATASHSTTASASNSEFIGYTFSDSDGFTDTGDDFVSNQSSYVSSATSEIIGGPINYVLATQGSTFVSLARPPAFSTTFSVMYTTSAEGGVSVARASFRISQKSIESRSFTAGVVTVISTSGETFGSSNGNSFTSSFSTHEAVTSGTFGSSSTGSSASGTGTFNNTFSTYNYTTTTSATTASITTTVTSTRASTFLSSSSASSTTTGTTTSTAIVSTAISSSSDPFTTTATSTGSQTITTYSSSTLSGGEALDLIVEGDTNDWLWSVTTTGSDQISDVGSSFTKQTFSDQGTSTSYAVWSRNFTDSVSSYTYSRPRYSSSSVTSTVGTTTSSAYSLGASSNNASVPFTSTVSSALSYTTTQNTTFTYSTSTTTVSSLNLYLSTTFSTVQSTAITTTFSGGTSLETQTWSIAANNSVQVLVGTSNSATSESGSIDNGDFTEYTSYSAQGGNSAGATKISNNSVFPWMPSVSVQSPGSISAKQITIGAGFQSPASIGRLNPIGTNLVAGTDSSVGSIGLGWTNSDRVPVVSQSDAIGLAGSVPATRINSHTETKFGGFGWDSTASTVLSAAPGIHRMTTANSTTTGTDEKSWNSTASTYALSSGHALVAESVPLVNSARTTSYKPFANFPAFPST